MKTIVKLFFEVGIYLAIFKKKFVYIIRRKQSYSELNSDLDI